MIQSFNWEWVIASAMSFISFRWINLLNFNFNYECSNHSRWLRNELLKWNETKRASKAIQRMERIKLMQLIYGVNELMRRAVRPFVNFNQTIHFMNEINSFLKSTHGMEWNEWLKENNLWNECRPTAHSTPFAACLNLF